jgi:shikimate dehydrogenase
VQPGDLERAVDAARVLPVSGASVTIPHKQTVMGLLDGLTSRAQAVGAVNTLCWDGDQLLGENTDVAGIAEPLRRTGKTFASALVLGAGGAARAALAALRELEVPEVFAANRTRSKAEALAGEFGAKVLDWEERGRGAQLLVNTTPVGMAGELEGQSPLPTEALAPGRTVFDLVYNPLETRLVRQARVAGCDVVEGLAMFVHQGLAQFRLWTGRDLDAAACRELLLRALQA